ncbi:D-alanyl-D-alanine carboxypeptidase/D-alanyl-D-alanine-endopeptidase, partial [Crocinitomix sp.]|nr:D-alanyl-D-alanine carboxypeptidase/D-alanyl-D-alanine-endopeptidase [Crocinitomix sp.]
FGINFINGRIITDASKYNYDGVPSGWVWGDIGNYYGAGPSGLTIFDNMCKLEFETGQNAGDPTRLICIEPYIPGLAIQNNVVSADSKSDNAYVYGAPYSKDWYVDGSIPKRQKSFIVKASIPDPEYLAAIELNQAIEAAGIKVKFAPTTNRELNKNGLFVRPKLNDILTHESPSLASIMNWVNQHSINLFAEHILCEISYKSSGYGSTNYGAQYCMRYWESKAGTGLFMTDGSGLSRSNAVSAKFFVNLLDYMHSTKAGESFKSTLAIAGKKGTLSSIGRGTAASGRVYGKSGTMSRIKSYAGYVDTTSGKKLAYAMIINNQSCSNSQMKKYFQNLMVKMVNY